MLRFRFFLWKFSIFILLISSRSLYPHDPFRHPFCSRGSNSFCSRNEYVRSIMIEVNCRVSICTESHKICKAWAFIDHVLLERFRSYWLWLNKSSDWVTKVDISESTNIKQSISMNRFFLIETLIFIRYFFVFP